MRPFRLALGAAGVGAFVHAVPGALWLDPLRRRLPWLAGIGEPDHVALTFDDGPDPQSTPAILAELDRLSWHATFFLLGSMTARAPKLAAELVAAGHEVGVHGHDHLGALRHAPSRLVDDLRRAYDIVGEATGTAPVWYRPPMGEMSAGTFLAVRRVGVHPVLWTAWGRDWRAEATADSVLADVGRGLLPGGTILLHDSDCTSAPGSWRTTLAALEPLSAMLAHQALRVGPLREHGVPPVPALLATP